MVNVVEELTYLQTKTTYLHNYNLLYLKIVLTILVIISRFIHIYIVLLLLVINVALLLYIGAKRVLITTFSLWCILSSFLLAVNYLMSTISIDILFNLVYGFTTFTTLTLFFVTTPPSHLRKLLGLNAISLTYLFLGYSIKLVLDLIDILRARGWQPRITNQKYLLRSFSVLLVMRISEVEEALKARGVEE